MLVMATPGISNNMSDDVASHRMMMEKRAKRRKTGKQTDTMCNGGSKKDGKE